MVPRYHGCTVTPLPKIFPKLISCTVNIIWQTSRCCSSLSWFWCRNTYTILRALFLFKSFWWKTDSVIPLRILDPALSYYFVLKSTGFTVAWRCQLCLDVCIVFWLPCACFWKIIFLSQRAYSLWIDHFAQRKTMYCNWSVCYICYIICFVLKITTWSGALS